MRSQFVYYQTLVFYFLFFSTATNAQEATQKGIACVPIAHLVGQPLGTEHVYHALPLCGASRNPHLSCPRVHQLLLHETVDIIKVECDELFIDIPHIYFVTENNKVPQTRYWTSKKNIIPIAQLKKNNVQLDHLPKPINFQNPSSVTDHEDVVTLLKPFIDPATHASYSAGTRFMVSKTTKDKKHWYVYALDQSTHTLRELKIPSNALIKTPQGTTTEKIQTFVDILKVWAHQEKGFIPYVWGGCSFAHLESSPTIIEQRQERNGILHSWYARKKTYKDELAAHSGFDCAGLINRAAQMAGIPFFFKNTLTIAENMHEIGLDETLQAGDIIWVRGHVMVIADTKLNTIIEARGYDSDYGRVHEIAIGKVFEGIRTMADLKRAWMEKTPLKRIKKSGKIQDTFKTFKLLKLRSVWGNNLTSRTHQS